MTDKRYKVPEEAIEAGFSALSEDERTGKYPAYAAFAEAVLRHISENPMVPTDEQIKNLYDRWLSLSDENYPKWLIAEWQRIAYLEEPEVPEEIKDLLSNVAIGMSASDSTENQRIIEAFNRGRKAGK
jgi:hypothetical protein